MSAGISSFLIQRKATKTKVDKWKYQTEKLCTKSQVNSKGKTYGMIRDLQTTPGKGLIYEIYKELNSKKINNPVKKWAKDPGRHDMHAHMHTYKHKQMPNW